MNQHAITIGDLIRQYSILDPNLCIVGCTYLQCDQPDGVFLHFVAIRDVTHQYRFSLEDGARFVDLVRPCIMTEVSSWMAGIVISPECHYSIEFDILVGYFRVSAWGIFQLYMLTLELLFQLLIQS